MAGTASSLDVFESINLIFMHNKSSYSTVHTSIFKVYNLQNQVITHSKYGWMDYKNEN